MLDAAAPHASMDAIPRGDDPVVKEGYIGELVEVHSLESRPELNGLACLVVDWKAESDRWAVESLAERTRILVRPSNLRPARVNGADPIQLREGGYTEEYVWLQIQE